jgi:hypothetical protein
MMQRSQLWRRMDGEVLFVELAGVWVVLDVARTCLDAGRRPVPQCGCGVSELYAARAIVALRVLELGGLQLGACELGVTGRADAPRKREDRVEHRQAQHTAQSGLRRDHSCA